MDRGVFILEIALLLPGQERWRPVAGGIEYDYCTERGVFFSCIAKTLDAAQLLCEDSMLPRARYSAALPRRGVRAVPAPAGQL